MCYTGKCKYEDYQGTCDLPWDIPLCDYPEDALCVQNEREQEQEAKAVAGPQQARSASNGAGFCMDCPTEDNELYPKEEEKDG